MANSISTSSSKIPSQSKSTYSELWGDSLDYMRPDTLKSGKDYDLSSSCGTVLDGEREFNVVTDIEGSEADIPVSSCPPECSSSSPYSQSGSEELEDDGSSSSSRTSESPDYLSDSVSHSQQNPSFVDLAACPNSDDFGERLHQLLLVALAERERERQERLPQISSVLLSSSDICATPDQISGTPDPVCGLTAGQTSNSSISTGEWFAASDLLLPSTMDLKSMSSSRDFSDNSSATQSNKLSPITLKEGSEQCLSEMVGKKVQVPSGVRIIKRAQSYIKFGVDKDSEEPPSKKQKASTFNVFDTRVRLYARRTASLRRADSLKSINNQTPTIAGWIPTVPSTPMRSNSKDIRSSHPKKRAQVKVLRSPVPVIAPPKDHTETLPLNVEAQAKIRLHNLLARETDGRLRDGLTAEMYSHPPLWMLSEVGFNHDLERNSEDDIKSEWEAVLCLGRRRRRGIIDWLLNVLPERVSNQSDSHSCSSEQPGFNLRDQLLQSPETRFHAIWMFLRFSFLSISPDLEDESSSLGSASSSRRSSFNSNPGHGVRDLIMWDVALASLALSVKFHRDFLEPLLPVFAQEYLAIALHAVDYDDLENAHRDILSAFDYRLGITPQPVMDELWLSLPSLRELLGFEAGWESVMQISWSFLYVSLREPDVQRFRVSTLTAVAVMDGILEALIHQYNIEGFPCLNDNLQGCLFRPTDAMSSTAIRTMWKKYKKRAKQVSEGVFCDIQALVGITDVHVEGCRRWLRNALSKN